MVEAAYRDYLARFEREVGIQPIGGYGKWQGRLVKKLTLDEFTVMEAEYRALCDQFEGSVLGGGTINNRLLRQLRDRSADLVLPPPL